MITVIDSLLENIHQLDASDVGAKATKLGSYFSRKR